MKRVFLVTGAAGFLGSTVCRQLLEKGEKVRALVLAGDKAKKFIPEGVDVIDGDLCDMASLDRFFDVPADTEIIVLHVASIVCVNPEYNAKVMDVNLGGTMNIVDECKSHPNFRKLVYVSSTGAIPELPKGWAIREVKSFDPNLVRGCYSQSKALASQVVLDAAAEGLDACIVHPSGILGPGDFAIGETTGTIIRILKGEMPMGIDGSFNLCDVRDLAAGVISAAEHGRKGECYILANDEVQFKDFAALIAEAAGIHKISLFLSCGTANFLAGKMEEKAKKKGEKPLMTTFSVYNLDRNNVFDSFKARRELGYRTRSYRETMLDEIEWLKQQNLIG